MSLGQFLSVVLNNRFYDPIKPLIGGIQSNLVNSVIWFNIKPNYSVFINDSHLEDTKRIRIKAIHELTKLTQISTKPLNKNLVEIL